MILDVYKFRSGARCIVLRNVYGSLIVDGNENWSRDGLPLYKSEYLAKPDGFFYCGG